ncbi:hypothetical protein [Aquifex aeolicus]|uniref:hypothetical protein n=1 Tax=Aquifex aeolicus TaxID=63363 RepID=UPI00031B03A2|nr:hypothetical protein [Aquifex aeolicus]
MVQMTEEKLISLSELLEELNKKGIPITRSGIYYWILRGFIPQEYMHIKRLGGRKRLYYFKPEVVDYLLEKLSE